MFWGLVFAFLYLLYVYDRAINIFGVLEKGYDGIKGFDDLRKIFGSRIVRDFNENMTWIRTVFGSVIGCVTKSSSKTSCRPTELAVRPTATKERSAKERQAGAQRRSAQPRSARQECNEGALSAGANERSAKERNEGALSAGAKKRNEAALSQGAPCRSAQRCSVL